MSQPQVGPPDTDVLIVHCNCCEAELLAKRSVLARIAYPATWCSRCLATIPFLILRKIFVMNLAWAEIQNLKNRVSELDGQRY